MRLVLSEQDVNSLNMTVWEAAFGGLRGVVSRLAASGAVADKSDEAGWTPLVYAAYAGHTEIVEDLLEIDSSGQPKTKKLALEWAAREGKVEVVKLLLPHLRNESSFRDRVMREAADRNDRNLLAVLESSAGLPGGR